MKRLTIAVLAALIAGSAQAEWVNGYTKRDGTYVGGYYRTERDGNPYNNLTPPPKQDFGYTVPRSSDQQPQPRYEPYKPYQPYCGYGQKC
jgi:hypothetical protein